MIRIAIWPRAPHPTSGASGRLPSRFRCGAAGLAAGALSLLVGTPASAEPFEITRGDRTDEVVGSVDGCAISLTYDKRDNFVRYRNRCQQTLGEKARSFDRLLGALFPDSLPVGLDSFSAGRMIQLSPELSQRLAVAAYRSRAWNSMLEARRARGPGDHGMANTAVAKLIDAEDLYREILQPLRSRGMNARVVGIEKVLMVPSDQGPLRDWLAAQSIVSSDELPFDAIVWFALTPEAR